MMPSDVVFYLKARAVAAHTSCHDAERMKTKGAAAAGFHRTQGHRAKRVCPVAVDAVMTAEHTEGHNI
jgi:hypothetical protein